MPNAIVLSSQEPDAPPLAADLQAVGITVIDLGDSPLKLQEVVRAAPDFIILYAASPDSAFFDSILAVSNAAPCPVVVFTVDPDAEKIEQAIRSGVNAYIINGYGKARLRSVAHLAQVRFRFDQVLRGELTDVNQRFAERKLIDRAKGILMGARHLREEQAYSALRSAAMRTKQRIGQVARQVIDSARYAEAINQAGQLRMLSQRLVKLYALRCAAPHGIDVAVLFAAAASQVDATLATLERALSKPTFGDLLESVAAPWRTLRRSLALPESQAGLLAVDALAEEMLLRAELLTENLEIAGFAVALHVINVAGRQRMLAERFAKAALLAALLGGAAEPWRAEVERLYGQIEESLAYLDALPMTNPEITRELAEARALWAALLAVPDIGTPAWGGGMAATSEALLASFERLTDQLERAVQSMLA